MNSLKAHAIFDYWFEQHGHWMFGTKGKEKAIDAWKFHGIEGLPRYQPLA
jgi:hypothetical protein